MTLLMFAEAANTHTRRWVGKLVERGWDVRVISVSTSPVAGAQVVPHRVPGFGWRYPARWPGRYVRWLRDVVAEARTDLIHVHFLQPYPLAEAVGGTVPIVVSTWGSDVIHHPQDPVDSPEQHGRKMELLQSAVRVTATTEYLADRTAEFGGLDRNAIEVIPFGVDVERFTLVNRQTSKRAPVVGYVKHLEARYGLEYLIRAMPAIRTQFPDVRLLIAGKGPDRPVLAALAEELGVWESIDWVGWVPNEQITDVYGRMDVYVMPSVGEAFGVTAVEAQAAGVPVVYSNLPGVTEAVTDGIGGLAVPPRNPEAIATAVCRLLADSALRSRLGEAGRRFVRQRFDFDENVSAMERVYAQVIESRRPEAVC